MKVIGGKHTRLYKNFLSLILRQYMQRTPLHMEDLLLNVCLSFVPISSVICGASTTGHPISFPKMKNKNTIMHNNYNYSKLKGNHSQESKFQVDKSI